MTFIRSPKAQRQHDQAVAEAKRLAAAKAAMPPTESEKLAARMYPGAVSKPAAAPAPPVNQGLRDWSAKTKA